ncbi:hypothetical protein [Pseudogemmobacter sonorensis]|uniref:hypothetical protein n=1 Tax=Pseudogemmobacter sonorensis TaxID=2989681 RepID=UPI00367B0BC0
MREAFEILIAGLHRPGVFMAVPHIGGSKKALHLRSRDGDYFAVIANRAWLLWYFRRPDLRDGIFRFDRLVQDLPGFHLSSRNDPSQVEGLYRITTREKAEKVLDQLRACIAANPQRFTRQFLPA